MLGIGDCGLGIADWGLGIADWEPGAESGEWRLEGEKRVLSAEC